MHVIQLCVDIVEFSGSYSLRNDHASKCTVYLYLVKSGFVQKCSCIQNEKWCCDSWQVINDPEFGFQLLRGKDCF